MMKHKRTVFLFCLASVFGALVLLSFTTNTLQQQPWVAPKSADALKNPFPLEPLTLTQGEEIYSLYCWPCHGDEGYGDGAAGGALGVLPANFHSERVKKQTDGALYWKISNGRGNMPPYKEALSDEQRWQLVVYLRELGKDKKAK
jgi:mono/diheme cytochrome c family protein